MSEQRWTDDRLDDLALTVRAIAPVAGQIGGLEASIDSLKESAKRVEDTTEHIDQECTERDRRLHARIDQLSDRLSDRDREYRRNIVLALGPIAVVALLIGARLIGIDIHP